MKNWYLSTKFDLVRHKITKRGARSENQTHSNSLRDEVMLET